MKVSSASAWSPGVEVPEKRLEKNEEAEVGGGAEEVGGGPEEKGFEEPSSW